MLYKIIFILIFSQSLITGQSLFNRWIGSNPFTGSARSTAMGHTHLLNSSGSGNSRFNPAKLTSLKSNLELDIQIDRFSVFERWSLPVRDSFGEFLTMADYVSNNFRQYGFRGGLSTSTSLLGFGKIGFGFHYAQLSHFTYHYLEEVRGSYKIEDGEYASKDPIVGYHDLKTSGILMVSSIGSGLTLNLFGEMTISAGAAISLIQPEKISDNVELDTLYSNVTNLSNYPDIQQDAILSESNFLTLSTNWALNSNVIISASWEDSARSTTQDFTWTIDSTNGLFQYWKDGSYVVNGANYIKPEIASLAISFISNRKQQISIDLEVNQILYHNHLNLNNYRIFKFGFEYMTQMDTPIRGGLVYKTPAIRAMKPVTMFTFGTGKTIGNLIIDVAGTYSFHSFYYSDLFQVEGDNRPDYDLVRESELQLQLALTYRF